MSTGSAGEAVTNGTVPAPGLATRPVAAFAIYLALTAILTTAVWSPAAALAATTVAVVGYLCGADAATNAGEAGE